MNTQRYRVILIGWLVLLFVSPLCLPASPGFAQTPEPTDALPAAAATPAPAAQATAIPLEQSPPGITEVTFAQLNQPTFELRSPIGQLSFDFNVPYRWNLAQGDNYLDLHYDMQYEAHDPASQAGAVNVAVTVYYNDTLLTTFIPTEGSNQTLRLPIPPEAVGNPGKNPHRLRFVHVSGDCDDYFERSEFVVHQDSFIHYDYELLPLDINLADFPRPLVQNLFSPESILLVIPDDYSDSDLAATASVAAALGHRTFNGINLDVVTASDATPERLANTSAVIIGQPDSNSFLLDLYQRNRLPTTLTNDGSLIAGSATQPIGPDDGVLQEVVSDFNPDHVYLIVTGSSDEAVTYAARALSVLEPRYGFDGNLVVVSEFHEFTTSRAKPVDTFSLADLGFRDTTLYGLDARSTSVRFFIPANWRLTEKPTLTLSYLHSGVLQPSSSGLTIHLNGKPVAGVPVEATSVGEREIVVDLPTADIKPGTRNRLTFEANLNVHLPGCTLPQLEATWFRINESSQLKLPHTETEEPEILASLDEPLTPFASSQDMSDVWFSLPENPTLAELKGMIQIAAQLGNFSDGPGFAPRVSRGAIRDTADLERYHVIAFGLPTHNPVIASVNDQLPQPFMPNENNLRQQVGNIVYHLPDPFSLGLLQALSTPWNPKKKVMLVITGTTPEGVQWATEALTNEVTYYDLKGDLAFIRGERVESFESAKFIRGVLASAVEAVSDEDERMELAVAPTVAPSPAAPTPEAEVGLPQNYIPRVTTPPAPINPLTLALILAGVVVAVVGGLLNWRRAKSH